MIQLDGIEIFEFRGIRNLSLPFRGKNYAICGPNGTGKSGVVDAIEFGLTGSVSRLAGEGQGGLSVKFHSPHVDFRNNPKKALVRVHVSIPSIGKKASIERSPSNPSRATVTPNDPDVVAVLSQVALHPEIVLSRRELIRYVLATPGKRAEEVQALLHLDRVDKIRGSLGSIANNAERSAASLQSATNSAQIHLLRGLEIANLSKDRALAAVNSRRTVLGLNPLDDLKDTTSLKDGLETAKTALAQRIPKGQAIADIEAALEKLQAFTSVSIRANASELAKAIQQIADNPLLKKGANLENFYRTAIDLIEAEMCPLCDKPWEIETLRKHVTAKVQQLQEFSETRSALEAKLAPVATLMLTVKSQLASLVNYGRAAVPPFDLASTLHFSEDCGIQSGKIAAFLPLAATLEALKTVGQVPQQVFTEIEELKKKISSLPEPTLQEAAREWLVVADERLEVYRKAKREERMARERAQTAKEIYSAYVDTSDEVLKGIYANVESEFGDYYRTVNHGDEDQFKAQLVPSMGKLGFDVDFYGRGFFPPGAYHSEGHQDGMGLCLYLALMSHLHRENFTFAVLDDVLMSVDVAHRREVCRLLKKHFPKTQFIMTTHDRVWLRHMKTEALIGGKIEFKTWTVDQGPTNWDDKEDVWKEIEVHLQRNEVRAAAALLRHHLEYVSAELCDSLRAQVTYRGDGNYSLGDLLPSAIGQMKKLLKAAKNVAAGWNQSDTIAFIEAREKSFNECVQSSSAEEWQLNKSIHYNEWANMEREDFQPVVAAYKALLHEFACDSCQELFKAVPDFNQAEFVKCGCGKVNLNLVKKRK